MASLVYNNFKRGLASGEFDIHTAGDDVRAALLMNTTTADTEEETALMNAFSLLDECDATGYARVALASEVVATDAANDRAEFDADDVVFSGLGGDASRDYQGVLIYKHVTDDTDSIPLFFVDFSADITLAATQVTIPWDAQGILQVT